MNQYLVRFTHTTLATVLLILTAWLVTSAAQQRDRVVLTRFWRLEPVKIVNVTTKNKAKVQLGKPFAEQDDWLDGLTLTATNNQDKTITALTVSLVFAEPDDPRPPLTWELHFGPSPNSPEYLRRDPNKVIKAGETVELRLSREDYQSLKRRFEQAGYSSGIKRLEIEVIEVGFEDGSMVYDGRLYLQDPAYPNDPTKKINNRYHGKPLIIVLENYVLHCVGALEPERYQVMQELVQRTFGGGADWKQTIRGVLHLEDGLDEHLRTMWRRNQEIAAANGAVLHPAEFAAMIVDQNFAPRIDKAASEKARDGSGTDGQPAAAAVVEADPKSWKEFLSESGRFRIMFPGNPVESDNSSGLTSGRKFTLTTTAYYFAGYEDLSPSQAAELEEHVELRKQLFDKIRDETRDAIQAKTKITLFEEAALAIDGYPGRATKIRMENGDVVRNHSYLVGRRLYQIFVVIKESMADGGRFDEMRAAKFLNSFKLTGGTR